MNGGFNFQCPPVSGRDRLLECIFGWQGVCCGFNLQCITVSERNIVYRGICGSLFRHIKKRRNKLHQSPSQAVRSFISLSPGRVAPHPCPVVIPATRTPPFPSYATPQPVINAPEPSTPRTMSQRPQSLTAELERIEMQITLAMQGNNYLHFYGRLS
jgi:hypothetical protein